MNHVLRRIRRQLMESQNTRKYLLYALGEIVLVVMGILIALQINNWNEWRRDRVKELSILTDLEENIQRNREQLSHSSGRLAKYSQSKDFIIKEFVARSPYNDSMRVHFHDALRVGGYQINFSYDGYESYKNAGYEIILNKGLKDHIIALFENAYKQMETSMEYARNFDIQDNHKEDHYFYYDSSGHLEPMNYETLVKNKRYISDLNRIQRARSYLSSNISACLKQTDKVHDMVLAEIDNRR